VRTARSRTLADMPESLTIAPAPSLRSRLSFRQATSRPVISAAPQAKGVRPRLRRLLLGPAASPAGPAVLIALLVGRRPSTWSTCRPRGWQRVLRRCRQVRDAVAEGLAVRIPRRSQRVTVDKPPAALWILVLSARIFGFSSFSMLLPQALGVGTVAPRTPRSSAGRGAGLVAGAVRPHPVAALCSASTIPTRWWCC
jgi:hypothetical protein